MRKRREVIFEKMSAMFDDEMKNPKTVDEVGNITNLSGASDDSIIFCVQAMGGDSEIILACRYLGLLSWDQEADTGQCVDCRGCSVLFRRRGYWTALRM